MTAACPHSTITCPNCGFSRQETMPTDSCRWFWRCPACQFLLKPDAGDCCVYCSYGSVPCPPVQARGKGACCDN
ncbi:MAG: GDCCVxC domain-containing (seleno)protein [Rhodanobacteraceae bacterium]